MIRSSGSDRLLPESRKWWVVQQEPLHDTVRTPDSSSCLPASPPAQVAAPDLGGRLRTAAHPACPCGSQQPHPCQRPGSQPVRLPSPYAAVEGPAGATGSQTRGQHPPAGREQQATGAYLDERARASCIRGRPHPRPPLPSTQQVQPSVHPEVATAPEDHHTRSPVKPRPEGSGATARQASAGGSHWHVAPLTLLPCRASNPRVSAATVQSTGAVTDANWPQHMKEVLGMAGAWPEPEALKRVPDLRGIQRTVQPRPKDHPALAELDPKGGEAAEAKERILGRLRDVNDYIRKVDERRREQWFASMIRDNPQNLAATRIAKQKPTVHVSHRALALHLGLAASRASSVGGLWLRRPPFPSPRLVRLQRSLCCLGQPPSAAPVGADQARDDRDGRRRALAEGPGLPAQVLPWSRDALAGAAQLHHHQRAQPAARPDPLEQGDQEEDQAGHWCPICPWGRGRGRAGAGAAAGKGETADGGSVAGSGNPRPLDLTTGACGSRRQQERRAAQVRSGTSIPTAPLPTGKEDKPWALESAVLQEDPAQQETQEQQQQQAQQGDSAGTAAKRSLLAALRHHLEETQGKELDETTQVREGRRGGRMGDAAPGSWAGFASPAISFSIKKILRPCCSRCWPSWSRSWPSPRPRTGRPRRQQRPT